LGLKEESEKATLTRVKETVRYKRFDLFSVLAVLGILLVLLFEAFFVFELYDVEEVMGAEIAPEATSVTETNGVPSDSAPVETNTVPAVTNDVVVPVG
jgi:hypothetical protein